MASVSFLLDYSFLRFLFLDKSPSSLPLPIAPTKFKLINERLIANSSIKKGIITAFMLIAIIHQNM